VHVKNVENAILIHVSSALQSRFYLLGWKAVEYNLLLRVLFMIVNSLNCETRD